MLRGILPVAYRSIGAVEVLAMVKDTRGALLCCVVRERVVSLRSFSAVFLLILPEMSWAGITHMYVYGDVIFIRHPQVSGMSL